MVYCTGRAHHKSPSLSLVMAKCNKSFTFSFMNCKKYHKFRDNSGQDGKFQSFLHEFIAKGRKMTAYAAWNGGGQESYYDVKCSTLPSICTQNSQGHQGRYIIQGINFLKNEEGNMHENLQSCEKQFYTF